MFLVCVSLNLVPKLDDIALLLAKDIVKEFRWRRGGNVLWCCVEDGGHGVCASDVHRWCKSLSQPLKCNSHSNLTKPLACQVTG